MVPPVVGPPVGVPPVVVVPALAPPVGVPVVAPPVGVLPVVGPVLPVMGMVRWTGVPEPNPDRLPPCPRHLTCSWCPAIPWTRRFTATTVTTPINLQESYAVYGCGHNH